GANKVVCFEVSGAKDDNEARISAKALSNSPLVKTAIFGEDPNWGRIASTIGASGVECDELKLVIKYDDVLVYDKFNTELTAEREEQAHKVMQKDSFKISCDLGVGQGKFSAYGCDLSYDYVKINADYRS
ncbi:MAG: bifunctional ornithine acetyltransferase/N-acetylglutamate synthase, partial [Campylobacter sp.]|nr:bifunctional ornithine acetyltransferase/N-acetylglutamate synthase [Campylobacter sp.]